jgi:hypothetical protein
VDVVVFADRTPNLDLVLAAGGRVEWRDGRLAPRLNTDGQTSVRGLFAAGGAVGASTLTSEGSDQARRAGLAAAAHARAGAGIGVRAGAVATRAGDPPRSASDGRPPSAGSPDAVLCFCEDVRAREVAAERTAGYADPELIKRRTGALTGPCQGKYCLSAVSCAISDVGMPAAGQPEPDATSIVLPTGRPPLRPIRLGDLAIDGGPTRGHDALADNTGTSDHR